MTFDEAVKKSVKVFLQGKMPIKTGELKEEGLFYTPEYFNELEDELLEEPTDSKKAKDEELNDEA
jgi:hypothetical protein|tara:strand:- start:481 stop:675 length:195 start_codon:yes stop_codon:yes gene_type:complete